MTNVSSKVIAFRLLGIGAMLVAPALPAFALDTSLDNVKYDTSGKEGPSTATIKHIDITGTNLTQDEVAKLFAAATPKDQRTAILAKMQATKISAPEVVVESKDSKVTISGLVAEKVDQGKAGHLAITSINGTTPPMMGRSDAKAAGQATIKSGAIVADGVNLAGVLAGDPESGKMSVSHLSWTGLEINTPNEKGAPLKISLDSLVADTTMDGDVPLKTTAKIGSLKFIPDPSSDEAKSLAVAGYDKLDMGMTVSGTYNPAAKSYALEDMTISGVGVGSIGLKGQFASIDKAAFAGKKEARMGALMQGAIAALEIKVVNTGAFEKGVAFYAKSNGKTPDAVKAEWSGMAGQMLPLLLGGDPSSLKIAGAVSSFVTDAKTLTLNAKSKAAPVPFMELAKIKEPAALLQKVDVTAVASK